MTRVDRVDSPPNGMVPVPFPTVTVRVVLPLLLATATTSAVVFFICQTGVLEKVIVIPPLTSFSASVSTEKAPLCKVNHLLLTWLKWLVKLYKIAAFFDDLHMQCMMRLIRCVPRFQNYPWFLATHGQSMKAFSSCHGLILSRVYSERYVQKTLAKK